MAILVVMVIIKLLMSPLVIAFFTHNRRVKTPKGTTDRDFVMYVTHGVDSNGVYYVLYKNATHPKRPEIPGVIRYQVLVKI